MPASTALRVRTPGGSNRRSRSATRIFPDCRRRGYATEAVRALLAWAEQQGTHHFIASIAPDNAASLALVRRLGFQETGRHWDDEDGEELEFELLRGVSGGA